MNNSFPSLQAIVDGLSRLGHTVNMTTEFSVVQTVFHTGARSVTAVCDGRKDGVPDGV